MHAVLLVLALGAVGATEPQESVERLREKLAKPAPTLTVPEIKPDFKVKIEERRPLQDLFDIPPWALDPRGWQPSGPVLRSAFGTPMIGVNLLSLFSHGPLPAYIPYTLDEQTRKAIAAYCAAQPKDGTRVLICEP
jgi:hypothetical protein